MVRNKTPTSRVRQSDEVILEAIQAVIDKKLTLRVAAETYQMKKSTLARAVVKHRKKIADGIQTPATFQPNHGHQIVFTTDEEKLLEQYIIDASKRHHGMTKKLVQEFAYEYAQHLNKKYPTSWNVRKIAGM